MAQQSTAPQELWGERLDGFSNYERMLHRQRQAAKALTDEQLAERLDKCVARPNRFKGEFRRVTMEEASYRLRERKRNG
jgi:hypothetical protein